MAKSPLQPTLHYSAHVTAAGVRYTYGTISKTCDARYVSYGVTVGLADGFALREHLACVHLFTSELEGRRALDLWRSYNHPDKCPAKPYLRGRKAVR